MTNRAASPALLADLAAEPNGSAPEWVELLPAGPQIAARDGRRWRFDPATILAAFAANRGPLAIDYEHGQDLVASRGEAAPAAGWITALEERRGAIWGRVEWTATAARLIAERAYRYLSPSMRHTRDGLITRLAGAGLVNRPALEMTALSREEDHPTMTLKAIARSLGLAEDADEAAVLAAIAALDTERRALCRQLGLDEGADATAIETAVARLRTESETALARQRESSAAELEQLRTSLASLETERRNEKIEAALDRAQSAGKITPASRADYRAMCAAEGGLERFEALARTLPVIAEPSRLGQEPPLDDLAAEDPIALAARATKYRDEQAALGRHIPIDVAVMEVKDRK